MKSKTFQEVSFFRWLCEDAQEGHVEELVELWKSEFYDHLVYVWNMPKYIAPRGTVK